MPILHCGTAEYQRQAVQAGMQYAALGLRVVLLHGVLERNGQPICTCSAGENCTSPGKHPRLSDWPALATCDEETIAKLWQRYPASNVGVKLGPDSGIADVEFDDAAGEATARQLLGGCFTPTFNSARSVHRIFRFPAGVVIPKAVMKAGGLELRFGTDSKGAQTVFPPSVHAKGINYRWATGLSLSDVDCEPFPEALLELMTSEAGGSGNGDGFSMEGHFWESAGVGEGERYDTLGRLAGRYLAAYGVGDWDNYLSHALAWNAKCQPPKDAAAIEKLVRFLWEKETTKRQAMSKTEAVQPASGRTVAAARLVTRRYSTIESKPIDWLWPGKVPLGMVTILAGYGGWGKSTVASDLAARLSTGSPWPDGSPCAMGDALLVSAEESAEYMVKARLKALGADCNRIHDLCYVEANGEERPLTLPGDAGIVKEMLLSLPGIRLVVIDTIADVLGNIDENKNLAVRRCLAPLKRLAEEFGLAVVAIAHVGKAKDVSSDCKVLGSVGFTNLARCCWYIGADPADSEPDRKFKRRLWLPGKSNIPISGGMAFRTRWTGEAVVPVWEDGEVAGDADSLYRSQPLERESKSSEAADYLSVALANGPRLPGEVVREGETLGYSRSLLYQVAKQRGLVGAEGLWRQPKSDTYTF